MAEEHAILPEGNLAETSDGTRHLIQESTTTTESFDFFTANKDSNSTSIKNSIGCTSSPDPAASCSEYFSTRIQSIMESRAEFGSTLETEIEESKDHWSELQAGNGEVGSAEKNFEVYRNLQKQWGQDFFMNMDVAKEGLELGEKIAEGAEGAIYNLKWQLPEHAGMNDQFVLKVFKEGSCLQDLQKQWPQGMLLKAHTTKNNFYNPVGSARIAGGQMLPDGRFTFRMLRYWGDLRKVIDLRMLHNGNQAPPFTYVTALKLMYGIALGMRRLHKDNIVHRDLKASNVLIWPERWLKPLLMENILILKAMTTSSPILQILSALLECWGLDFGEPQRFCLVLRIMRFKIVYSRRNQMFIAMQ